MNAAKQYLVVRSTQPENAYGRFAQEILRSEGLMGFELVDLDTMPMPQFGAGDLVLITRCFLRCAEIDQVIEGIKNGASVVFIQPQRKIVVALGGKPDDVVIQGGYVKIHEGLPGAGDPLQTHLPIPVYRNDAESEIRWEALADAVDVEWQVGDDPIPAAVKLAVGAGRAVMFFYDLPEAVARIRFGDFDLASYNTIGVFWPHPCDLYTSYVDDRLGYVPQADYHCQFLVKVLTDVCQYPLVRMWYFENAEHRTAGVISSDGDCSTPEEFETIASALEKRDACDTFYLKHDTKLTKDHVDAFHARGHTFAPHVDPVHRDEELYFAFGEALAEENAEFEKRFGQRSKTLQCHFAPWMGYMHMVPAHIANGYRLLCAYLSGHWDTHWGTFMCGSGRPMRFCDRDGSIYDCYHQPVPTYDTAQIREKLGDRWRESLAEFTRIFDVAVSRAYTSLCISSHPVSFCDYSQRFMEGCFDLIHNSGSKIYSAEYWYEFISRRDAVRTRQSVDDSGGIVVTVSNLQGQLPLMVPVDDGERHVTIDGVAVQGVVHRRMQQDYVFIQLTGRDNGGDIRVEIQ